MDQKYWRITIEKIKEEDEKHKKRNSQVKLKEYLKMKPKTIIEGDQMTWFGHVSRLDEEARLREQKGKRRLMKTW